MNRLDNQSSVILNLLPIYQSSNSHLGYQISAAQSFWGSQVQDIYWLLCLSKLLIHCPTSYKKFSKTIMQITSHTIEYLGKCSDEACIAYGTLTCTRGTLSKEMRKKN